MEAIYIIQAELPSDVELPSKEWFKSNINKKDREDYLASAIEELALFKLTEKLSGNDNDADGEPESEGSTEATNEDTPTGIDATLAERGANYGKFTNHSELSQKLQVAFESHVLKYGQPEKYTDSMNEAIQLIMHKLARIANGDPTYVDNYVDISGYATLIVKELNGECI